MGIISPLLYYKSNNYINNCDNIILKLKYIYLTLFSYRIIDKPHSMLYIVTEYCSGGDLATLISQQRHQRSVGGLGRVSRRSGLSHC